MTRLRQLAEDPGKALRDLEVKLGAEPGDLLRDMEGLAPPGEEWGKHVSYRVAASYYDDDRARAAFEPHVDNCDYCKALLDTMHPTALDAASFSTQAASLHSRSHGNWSAKSAPYALAASVVLCAFGAWAFLQSQPGLPPQAFEPPFPKPAGTSGSITSRANPAVVVVASDNWVTDIKIGSGTDVEMQEMGSGEASFPAGKPVKLVADIQGAPDRTPISVIWIGPNNQEVRRETNWTRTGEETVAFSALDTTEWKTGDYRAELWVADSKIKQEPFEITPQRVPGEEQEASAK